MDGWLEELVAELKAAGDSDKAALAAVEAWRRKALAAGAAAYEPPSLTVEGTARLVSVLDARSLIAPATFAAAQELLFPRALSKSGGGGAATAAAARTPAVVEQAFATPEAARAAAEALGREFDTPQTVRTAFAILALCLRPAEDSADADAKANHEAGRTERAMVVLQTPGAVPALLRLAVGPPLCHTPELPRSLLRRLVAITAAHAATPAGGSMLRRMGDEVEAGAAHACDLIRAAWDSESGAAQHAAPRRGGGSRGPSPAAAGGRASSPGGGGGAAPSVGWLLFLAGQLAQRPAGARALLESTDVVPRIVDVFVARGAAAEALSRCMGCFEGLADPCARPLAQVAGRRLISGLLDVAAGRAPSNSGGGAAAAESSGGGGTDAAAAATAAEALGLPRRALALLVMISQDEAEGGAGQISLAVAPGGAATLVGVIDAAVTRANDADGAAAANGAAANGTGLSRLSRRSSRGSGAGSSPPGVSLAPEVRLAAILMELAGAQPDPFGPRFCDQAVAAGAVPVLLRALRRAGAGRTGAMLATAACVLLKSSEAADAAAAATAAAEDDDNVPVNAAAAAAVAVRGTPARRRSQDGAQQAAERAALQALAWDTICSALSAGVSGGRDSDRGSDSGGSAAPPCDAMTAPCGVNALSRLLASAPQCFLGFGAHPGALEALARAVAAPHGADPRAPGVAVRVLALLATYVAAAGSPQLQEQWVSVMQSASPTEPAARTAKGALEFIEPNSPDKRERDGARAALAALAAEGSTGRRLAAATAAALRRVSVGRKSSGGGGGAACAHCAKAGGGGVKLKPCPGCSCEVYCSRACRQAQWRAGHRVHCEFRQPAVSRAASTEANGKA